MVRTTDCSLPVARGDHVIVGNDFEWRELVMTITLMEYAGSATGSLNRGGI